MGDNNVDLSVVIAAYNEEAVIASNIFRVVEELKSRPEVCWELICVDDGSCDRTGTLLEEWSLRESRVKIIHHRRNFGQGRALRTAFDVVEGGIIVTLDADLSYGPEYIYQLVEAIKTNDCDISLASPFMKGGTVRNVPFNRLAMSRLANFYLAKLSNYNIATSTCVVRAYRRECIDMLTLTSDGMELQLEILMKAHMMGLKVCEIPALLAWSDVKTKKSSNGKRVSKMRISRSTRLYLLMGWLFKPAKYFMWAAILAIAIGVYMGTILLFKIFSSIINNFENGFIIALSAGLREVFEAYTYSFVFCGGFLIIGIQTFAFALLLIQNKFYFDELYKLSHIKIECIKHTHCSAENTKI